MAKSLTYHLTLLVIKLKGLKKTFSQDPIDYKEIRKEDVHEVKSKVFHPRQVAQFTVVKTQVTEIQQTKGPKKLLVFVHGGAFISGPARHHWDSIKQIIKATDVTVWLCNYPKAPEHKISEISANLDAIYQAALEKYQASEVCLMGDSVGGTLITALTQRLVKQGTPLPRKIILISPVMDATLSNPAIEQLELKDAVLSKKGVLSAKRLCAENGDLASVMISPLYGDFQGFPPTLLFLAENDITYADQQLAVQKMVEAEVDHEVIIGKHMPHIWPLLPVMKEAKTALRQIIKNL